MTRSKSGKGPSQRQLRMGELVRHELAMILSRGELRDPDLTGRIITVSEVRMSADMRHATAFVSELGGEHMEEIIRGLKRCTKYLRGEVGHNLTTRFVPELKFLPDELFNDAAKMEALLRSDRVAQDILKPDEEETPEQDGDEDPA